MVMTRVWLSCTWSGNIHLIRKETANVSIYKTKKKHTLSISCTEMQNMWYSIGRFPVVVPVHCLNVRLSAPNDWQDGVKHLNPIIPLKTHGYYGHFLQSVVLCLTKKGSRRCTEKTSVPRTELGNHLCLHMYHVPQGLLMWRFTL